MQLPLQITWHKIEKSAAIEADIRAKAQKLDAFCDNIISCRVVVDSPHRHHHKGNLYRLRLSLKVPDKEIIVTRDPADNHAHEDIYVSIRDAFDALRRQLQEYVRVRRGHVKPHEPSHTATVGRLIPDEDYGFLTTPEGDEVYFSRDLVVDAEFDSLSPGIAVHYVTQQGGEGVRAKRVSLIKREPETG